jgi:hypothetical protein
VQVWEMEGRKQLKFEEIKEMVKKDLMDKKHEKVMEKWEDELLKSAGFRFYDQTIKDVLAEEPQKAKES